MSAAAHPATQSGASGLGLPSRLGLLALRSAVAGAPEAHSAPDAGAPPARPPESAAGGQAHAHREHTQAHATARVGGIDMTKVLVEGFGWVCIVGGLERMR
jgi:hypothetical protein